MTIFVEQITNGPWKQHCYIVHAAIGEGFIIDPGSEADRIIAYVEDRNITPLAILNTHAHYDHIGAVAVLKQHFHIPFYLNSKDETLLKKANTYSKLFESGRLITIPEVDHYLDRIELPVALGSFSIDVFWTPGHTKGGVCFLLEDRLFVGDTLFCGKIGRVDLPGGNPEELRASLKAIGKFPQTIKIYPGHGRLSTIGDELLKNKQFLSAIGQD